MLQLPIFCAESLAKVISSNDIIRDNNIIIDCITPHHSFQQATKAIPRPFAMPAAAIYQQQLYTSSSCIPAAIHQQQLCTSSSYIPAAATPSSIYIPAAAVIYKQQQLYTVSNSKTPAAAI
jgi:hypothetical protein